MGHVWSCHGRHYLSICLPSVLPQTNPRDFLSPWKNKVSLCLSPGSPLQAHAHIHAELCETGPVWRIRPVQGLQSWWLADQSLTPLFMPFLAPVGPLP